MRRSWTVAMQYVSNWNQTMFISGYRTTEMRNTYFTFYLSYHSSRRFRESFFHQSSAALQKNIFCMEVCNGSVTWLPFIPHQHWRAFHENLKDHSFLLKSLKYYALSQGWLRRADTSNIYRPSPNRFRTSGSTSQVHFLDVHENSFFIWIFRNGLYLRFVRPITWKLNFSFQRWTYFCKRELRFS